MKILFTEEDGYIHGRARYIRGGLIKNYHDVKAVKRGRSIPDADIWFHGISHLDEVLPDTEVYERLEMYDGIIVLFQNDDGLEMNLSRIPSSLVHKAHLILRNGWPSDRKKIPENLRCKMGFLNPLLKPDVAIRCKELKDRMNGISFMGAPTGGERYTRIDALNMLKAAKIPFVGGIFKSPLVPIQPPPHLLIESCSKKEYMSIMENTRLSLVLHGYNPLTFRLFESFSRRCLALVQDLQEIEFVHCGLKDGVHFVSIKKDLSDLTEKCDYYLRHTDETQIIANNGYEHFKKYFAFTGVDLPQILYDNIVSSWNISLVKGQFTPFKFVQKQFLPFIHSL
jgi:hypothetical protein